MKFNEFFKEFKRRNVYHVGMTYVVVGWLVAQVVSLACTTFNAPDWVMQMVFIVLIAGFPVALVLAWAFEMSPQGIIRTTSSKAFNNPNSSEKKKHGPSRYIIGFLLLVIIGQCGYQKIWLSSSNSFDESISSVAVLPFKNISNNENINFLSEPIPKQINRYLSELENIRVVPFGTSMRYRDYSTSIDQVCKELSVDAVLTGTIKGTEEEVSVLISVNKAENQEKSFELSTEETNQDLLQFERAAAFNAAMILQPELSGGNVNSVFSKAPTKSVKAYKLYLRGRKLIFNHTLEDYLAGQELLSQAINLDPDFAHAYAEMGYSLIGMGSFLGVKTREETIRNVEPFLSKAVELDSTLIMGHFMLGNYWLFFHWDFDKAYQSIQKAANLSNQGIGIHVDFSEATGLYEERMKQATLDWQFYKAQEHLWFSKCRVEFLLGDSTAAENTLNELYQRFDSKTLNENYHTTWGRTLLILRKYEETVTLIPQSHDYPQSWCWLAIAHYHLGNKVESKSYMDKLLKESTESSVGSPFFHLGLIHAQMNEVDKAFGYLEQGFQKREPEMYWLNGIHLFEPLYRDPRWDELIEKVGIPEPEEIRHLFQ